MATTSLVGSDWDHVRGHAPLVAAAKAYAAERSVSVEWVPRTLTEFGVMDIAELAADFDLVVIDHPHVGGVAATDCLVPLDQVLGGERLAMLGLRSPGRSHQSYEFAGHQWALAIDAACQVSCWRPDLLDQPLPKHWPDVVSLARRGQVIWPLNPVDAQASFLTMAAMLGSPVGVHGIRPEVGMVVLGQLSEVVRELDPACLQMNAIDALELLSSTAARSAYCPMVFGYNNYSRVGFREHRVTFGATVQGAAPALGPLLGGVGLAVSARSEHIREAAEFALWVADGPTQSGLFVEAGGQPAHAAAWERADIDDLTGGFFSGTRSAMDSAWTRPREPGYVDWQNASLGVIHEALLTGDGFAAAVAELNRLAASLMGSE